MAEEYAPLMVRWPAGEFMRDDPTITYDKDCFWVRPARLKELYKELGDLLKWGPKYRTKENRRLRTAMAAAWRDHLDEVEKRERPKEREQRLKEGRPGPKGGAPKLADRCPCGDMTKARAAHLYHHCTKKGPVPSPRDMSRIRWREWEKATSEAFDVWHETGDRAEVRRVLKRHGWKAEEIRDYVGRFE
jgi:hypothetical protein